MCGRVLTDHQHRLERFRRGRPIAVGEGLLTLRKTRSGRRFHHVTILHFPFAQVEIPQRGHLLPRVQGPRPSAHVRLVGSLKQIQ